MNPMLQAQLLELNRAFYTAVASEFDQTRGGLPVGWDQLLPWLPTDLDQPTNVLDVGCGNGRFARFLAHIGHASTYLGVDGEATLLQLAAEQTLGLPHIRTHFAQVDLAVPGWARGLTERVQLDLAQFELPQFELAQFELIVCLAVLHHIPGQNLRQQLINELGSLLHPHGVLILSNWQFLTSPRLAGKQLPWSTIGVHPAEVEPGDALLPWQQGVQAVRYVHQLDEAEVNALAAAAGLKVCTHFYADGKNGRLNLYSICQREEPL